MTPCIVDTNVAVIANMNVPDELIDCALGCIGIIEKVIKEKSLVLDEAGEIFEEYRHNLSFEGQPGVGDMFLKWVYDNQWMLPADNRVSITKNGNSYNEFPSHEGLNDFDKSDRKFVAVSNAHPLKPKIYQATDTKWWGWKDALADVGIRVDFICSEYIAEKYEKFDS